MEIFQLENGKGLRARVSTFGATLLSLHAPDRDGSPGPVVLGFDDPSRYLEPHPHLGATVGRYANRIAGGRFDLDGRDVQLTRNEGPHHLHGGEAGFGRVEWVGRAEPGGVRLEYVSSDGEEGYPGRLHAEVTYRLTEANELRIDWRAHSSRSTVVNLTHHSYFNLRDGGTSPVLDHELQVNADAFTPVDARGIPTGELDPVEGTALDFREPRRLGERIESLVPERGGYDHNFALLAEGGLSWAARLRDPVSGRALEVRTTQPGLQLYTGNFLDGQPWPRWHGVCLETQHFPDSPNWLHFPSTRLEPGEEYAETVVYAFSVDGSG
ncbi:MAG: galactose mutarotase [Deltaproteobacteria bacterium]|nr:galactose mutarotase [Deltaproteobacteria bacterium]